jgi:rare lipoprotein A
MRRERLARVGGMVIVLAALTACATARSRPPDPVPSRALLGWEQSGQASWYGHPHHGRATASGEIYDMRALTAAHRTLPLGVRVLVTHLGSGRTVELRINDRGPFVGGRILDVSQAAAERLGGVGAGVFPVRLRVIALPDGTREAGARSPTFEMTPSR